MSAAITNTVHAVVRRSVLSVTCTASGAQLVMNNLKVPGSGGGAAPASDAALDLLDRAASLAFISRQSPDLSPVLVVCYADQLQTVTAEPSAEVAPASTALLRSVSVGGGSSAVTPARVYSVEPSQSAALVQFNGNGRSELVVAGLSESGLAAGGGSLRCAAFEVLRAAAVDVTLPSTAGGGAGAGRDAVLCVCTGAEAGQVAAGVAWRNDGAPVDLAPIAGLDTPDVVTCHALQRMDNSDGTGEQHFVWWAVWKAGVVTAARLVLGSNGVCRAMPGGLQRFAALAVPTHVAVDAQMCASQHGAAHVAIWDGRSACMYVAGVANNLSAATADGKNFLVVRSTQIQQLASPALCVRPARRGTLLLAVGMHSTNREPWVQQLPLPVAVAASPLSAAPAAAAATAQPDALALGRALLTQPRERLPHIMDEAERLLADTETAIRAPQQQQQAQPGEDIASLERRLLQLRAFRFAMMERERAEQRATAAGVAQRATAAAAAAPSAAVREWDRRLHTSFVLLQVIKLLRTSAAPSSGNGPQQQSGGAAEQARFFDQVRAVRHQGRASFIKDASAELRVPAELSPFSQWVVTWPAQLVIETAAEHVDVLPWHFVAAPSSGAASDAFVAGVVSQLLPLVERSMDVIDGCLEWVAFLALYAAAGAACGSAPESGASSQQQQQQQTQARDDEQRQQRAATTFLAALHLPPLLLQLASMARTVDSAYFPRSGNGNSSIFAVPAHQAAQLANQTCIPVRRLVTSLFSGLCDSGSGHNLRAAYTMTSVLTLSHLVRGDRSALDRSVALRLAFLAGEKHNQPLLAVLLRDAVGALPPARRAPDDEALALFLIAAAAKFAAQAANSLQAFEAHLSARQDQDTALRFLRAFGADKLCIELLVQAQRHQEALQAALQYSTTNSVEQSWAAQVVAHLRSITTTTAAVQGISVCGVPLHAEASSSSSAAAAAKSAPFVVAPAGDDAVVVRPIPAAFYDRGAHQQMFAGGGAPNDVGNRGRCRVHMPKTGGICGCEVPCPYHASA